MSKKKVVSRNILLLGLVSFFTDMASEMLYPITPIYFQAVGVSIVGVGIIEGMAELTAGVSKSYFGYLGDKLGRPEWFVRLGYGVSAVAKPLLGLAGSTTAFAGIRGADRLGKGIRTAPRDAILALESERSVRGRVFGFHRSLDTLGAAAGPFITIGLLVVLGTTDNLGQVYLWALVPGLAAVGLTFLVRTKIKKSVISINDLWQVSRQYPRVFRPGSYSAGYKKLLLGLGMVGLLNGSDAFLLLRAHELLGSGQDVFGVTVSATYLVIGIYIIYNIVYALLSLVTGSTADKLGFRWTFIAGLASFAICYGLLGRSIGLWGVVVAFVVYGLFSAVNDAVIKAWISRCLPRGQLGTGLGVANALMSFTFLVSSVLTGLIWQYYSAGAALSLLSIAMLVPIAFFVFMEPDNPSIKA